MPPKKVVKIEPNIILESDSDDEPKPTPIKKNTKKKLIIKEEETVLDNQVNNQINQVNENLTEDDFKEILKSFNKHDLEELGNDLILLEKRKDKLSQTYTELYKKSCLAFENYQAANILTSIEYEKLEDIKNIIIQVNKQTELLKNKAVVNKNIQANSIDTLIPLLNNEHQVSILNRIKTDSDYAKVYLQNFEPNLDPKKKTLKGTIKILGNYNRSKGVREGYEVKVFDKDPKGSFWCTCADHKFNSSKKNIVCKHICFIVCKVLKILQPYYFETKTLTPEHLDQLLNKFNVDSDMWKDKKIARTSNKITIQDFKNFPKPIVDTCSFCYDEMTDLDIPISCSCPLCKHCFHEECMGVWLETQSKCSFCSNEFWKYYKRIIGGEKEIDLGSSML
jgi:hypothetical protein